MTDNAETACARASAGSAAANAVCIATRRLLLDELMAQRDMLLCEAIRVLGSRERAEDAVQDAALRCLTSPSITTIRTSPRGLLRRMVHNIALDHWRRAAREVPMPDVGADLPSPCATPEQELAERQTLELARNMIRLLPPRQRHAIVQHRVHGRRQTDIAIEMGVSSARVHALIQRSHERLMSQLGTSSSTRSKSA